MKIRSITCFVNPNEARFEHQLSQAQRLVESCKREFDQLAWETQTARLATTPFGAYSDPHNALATITHLEKQASQHAFDYISVGHARITQPQEYELIPRILAETENVFCSASMSHHHRGISSAAVKACAGIITAAARILPDGFANLRFCATSHVKPFTPFFPASYSYGLQPAFALAMQCADAAVRAFENASSVAEGVRNLLAELENAARELTPIARRAEHEHGFAFKGFDFSLAPFPEDWCSLGGAFEKLGVPSIGYMGSLTAAAILADALDRGDWKRAGYNGLMLPVLEDSILAERTQGGHFTIKDLLLYSAVCGTGLDTVPLPGDTSAEMIEALLMDISALSLRLNKPLTARLMPVPGLKSGDMTAFDFGFFRNGQIMDFPAEALKGVLKSSEWLEVRKRVARIETCDPDE